ncbi:hypothetical protein ACWF0M_14215 [Kribbella sp. NPDC055110]
MAAAIVVQRDFALGFKKEQFGPGRAVQVHDFEEWKDDTLAGVEVALLCKAILFPSLLFSRIRESLTPLARSTQFRTAYTLRLPAAYARARYVPFTLVEKGTLFDDFHITTGDGSELPTLAYGDYVQLVAALLRSLANSESKLVGQEFRANVEERLMNLIVSRAPSTDEDRAEQGEVVKAISALDWKNGQTKALVIAIANILTVHYAVIAEVKPMNESEAAAKPDAKTTVKTSHSEHRLIITTERRILPHNRPRFRWPYVAWVIEHVRRFVGVRPAQFDIPIEKSHLSKSYHMEFMGPPSTYLARQTLDGYDSEHSGYARLRSRLGQRYTHLYVRDASRGSIEQVLRIAFFERTPGSLGAATVSALASAVLITIAGILASSSSFPDAEPRGDLMAILLALPGVAAAWVGLDRGSLPFGGTAAARLSSVTSFLLSLAAASYYLGAISSPHWMHGLNILGARGVWAWLAGAALLNFWWISYSWLRRALLYAAVLDRPTDRAGRLLER